MTIPVSSVVTINPSVIGGGGAALDFNGVILTGSTAVPMGSILPFPTADAVGAFFGVTSPEYALAQVYFLANDAKTVTPGRLYFAQYPSAAVAAYLRGGSVAGMTLAQLQALTGVLTVTVDGTAKTSSAISLSAATSFSNAATLIQAAFTTLGGTVTYDSQRAAFVFTSATTGAASSLSFATGSLAAGLNLTQATGALVSAGAIAATPAGAMEAITAATLNWASFMTVFEPVIGDKLAFAAWANSKNNRFAYIAWDTDITATQAGNTTSFGVQAGNLAYSGTVPVYGIAAHAAFIMGVCAAIDFARTNGRITFAFKSQSGLAASVVTQTAADNLDANGYNFYGAYASANQNFAFLYPGSVSGQYAFLDEYVNQVQLNSALQLALVSLLVAATSIPYNSDGYALIDAACMDPINAALNFGSIRENVPLSSQQAALVNTAAGRKIDTVLSSRGWYLQILPATAQVRAARGTPPITLFYMDGGSVQKISMASIVIQ